MKSLAAKILDAYEGKTLVTAESCTGGGIGQALTEAPGSSRVYLGGVISYCDEAKQTLLGVEKGALETWGAVSAPVAMAMAEGAREALKADVAVSVTGLAGPSGDDRGNPVGTVFLGYADSRQTLFRELHLSGDREQVRSQAVEQALRLLLEMAKA